MEKLKKNNKQKTKANVFVGLGIGHIGPVNGVIGY
jgi:hypothetical protein